VTSSNKTQPGNYFEDFAVGQVLTHATPRTVTEGDVALYTALYGGRFLLTSSAEAARAVGFAAQPIDDMLTFHVVFGKTVPDISLNAVANLGYGEGIFGVPVYAGDTLTADSEVIGLKENSNGKTGVVYVRSTGTNQRGETVVSYVRWVMVNKRDATNVAPKPVLLSLAPTVDVTDLHVPEGLDLSGYDVKRAGSLHRFGDYRVGERIDHVDGMTVEEAEHMMATRLYQNTAKVHFNQFAQSSGRFGRRLMYGGHVISIARALSFNGLGNAFKLAAINAGTHANPVFAGDTVFAWSEILDTAEVPGRRDVGAIRVRTVATKDQPAAEHPYKDADGKYLPSVLLDFDYWVLMPL